MTASFQTLRSQYASALKRFISSSKAFEIITSTPPSDNSHPPTPEVLYVLDSSFNPPTVAHLRIASSPFLEQPSLPSRLLLLLATQNADKPSKPAAFEDRLVMMEMFAQDLLSNLKSTESRPINLPQIDIGVTKKPYFVNKATEIESAGIYPRSIEQVHLIGYDTLIRVFNPKYYPPEHTLKPLEPFLARHRLRVTERPDDEWGSAEGQMAFLQSLSNGALGFEGARPEWAERIQFVKGKDPDEQPVSSTRARQAAKGEANIHDLEWLVPSNVRDYVLSQNPYTS
ncbi:hypothetical protein MPDQ_001895 [Monascus purpureus]|uniref:Nicotinamide-nucleotide adenylyltransferase n=1 Tax=Monascus purpureus TaxID=5098 RepID=A0A507QLI7_MONPU|nr:hypothetical protein MPDQ_001895 [Monascus purpureus]BDD56421.1 hypothetical protein MAP00_001880 [Monascus purpureus]